MIFKYHIDSKKASKGCDLLLILMRRALVSDAERQ